MSEMTNEQIFEEVKETKLVQVYAVAYDTAAALANMSAGDGETFISMEMMPILTPIMFDRYFIHPEKLNTTGDTKSFIELMDEMILNGEVKEIESDPYYGIFYKTVENYVIEANTKNDIGRQVLKVLNTFSAQIINLIENISSDVNGDLLSMINNFVHDYVEQMENIAQVAELSNNN